MAEAIHPGPEGFNARIGPTELAELHDDPRHGKNMLGYLLGWLESRNSI